MNGNKYETALAETQSVLDEWLSGLPQALKGPLAQQIVERLVAKGVIQDTDPEELQRYREGPLEPGRTVVGGPAGGPWTSRAERFEATKQWVLDEHGETLRRLGEGPSDDD